MDDQTTQLSLLNILDTGQLELENVMMLLLCSSNGVMLIPLILH